MQLVLFSSLAKSNAISSVVKSASCSRGWVRLLVQSIFAAVTVSSFILIVLMSIPKWSPTEPVVDEVPTSRCSIYSCRVVCRELPFFGEHEGEIHLAVTEAELHCNNVVLTLDSPMFINNTMPQQWLSNLRTNIYELDIFGGNLMHIPPDAFMSQHTRSIKILVFSDLVIRTWSTESFVGLSSLRRLYVKDSVLVITPRDVLRAVDDTLETLTLIRNKHWDPSNITGSTSFSTLTTVDFSSNDFRDILGQNSFTGLQKCKVLYLNSCRITSIGAGAFDKLESIEMLFLNHNYLVTIPDGLFKNIIPMTNPKPRINLQENSWYCDCSKNELRQLISNDMLLTDPVCKSPDKFEDKSFSELESYCIVKDIAKPSPKPALETVWHSVHGSDGITEGIDDISGFIYMSNGCMNGNATNSNLRVVSPVYGHGCPSKNLRIQGMDRVSSILKTKSDIKINLVNKWIKFSYFLQTLNYSMLQIGSSGLENYALVWYQSSCPNEVYCINDIPSVLRIYNVDLNANYIFCPILLSSGLLENDNCVMYNRDVLDIEEAYNKVHIIFYIATGLVCLIFGAICVYFLILKNPNLLKGSKRILFVKHKNVEALVLPPKVPLRNDLENDPSSCSKGNKIFIVPANHFSACKFKRNKSTRSSISNTPSYISALQPTEDQLAEWRIQHHFDNNLSITSIRHDISSVSWICNDNALQYSLDADNDGTYESLK